MTNASKALLIAATGEDPEPYRQDLARRLPGLAIHAEGEDYDPATIAYALCWKPTPGLLASLPGLEAIFSMGAGIDHILADPELPAAPPIVRLMHDRTRDQIRDYVVHAVLHYYRQMDVAARQQAEKSWKFLQIRDKPKLKVGILGLGEMGSTAAQGLNALGFTVLGWSRSPKSIEGVTSYHGADGLAEMLPEVSYLVSLLPATAETVGVLNAGLFNALPRGAVVINLGRGDHLVAEDLLTALDSGQIGAATLDVFAPEPMPEDSPFWSHPAVRVTPHIGSDGNGPIIADAVGLNIERMSRGLAPEPIGDRSRGY
ncbi:glyoxylate/hydroxypyruvate reductase A [Paracoccus sp. MBLB3053]|uniref:Glyoxylate/hydroxypyruvate reductase A n=1 Tax=Paracoccus aurantius TaxID=3073814 RepID=A0ABU2HY93_9RHOB|nr:glyoxylate/hydroxypyruvate reductase A [Paracoccus sp. MBLB3053]MDS9470037.1 glyoxylate/hydroxypyruvate reductase A [Paracoccus sp. MBLB3053]